MALEPLAKLVDDVIEEIVEAIPAAGEGEGRACKAQETLSHAASNVSDV